MITKNELRAYRDLKSEVLELKAQIEALEDLMTVPRTQKITGMPVAHGQDNDKIVDMISDVEDLRGIYCDKLQRLVALQKEIENAVDQLEPTERRLIRLYYFEGVTWEKVAVAMDYCWQHIHKLHNEILIKLSKMR